MIGRLDIKVGEEEAVKEIGVTAREPSKTTSPERGSGFFHGIRSAGSPPGCGLA